MQTATHNKPPTLGGKGWAGLGMLLVTLCVMCAVPYISRDNLDRTQRIEFAAFAVAEHCTATGKERPSGIFVLKSYEWTCDSGKVYRRFGKADL